MTTLAKLTLASSLLLAATTRAHAQAAPSDSGASADAVRDAAILEGRIVDPRTNSTRSYRGMMKPRSNQYAGFRNPGGVGRRAEYYPAGDKFQNEGKGSVAATFDGNHRPRHAGEVSRGRHRAGPGLQSHIDSYGRPLAWYGMGFGYGPGYGYPGIR